MRPRKRAAQPVQGCTQPLGGGRADRAQDPRPGSENNQRSNADRPPDAR